MSGRQLAEWKPALLMTLVGRFKSIEPNLELDWARKTAVVLTVSGEGHHAGKIVTNWGRGLRVELRAPPNFFTPAMVDRLGEDAGIKHHADDDWVIFWVRKLDQIDASQLRNLWRRCRDAGSPERLQSA
jgi:hypothetical protein